MLFVTRFQRDDCNHLEYISNLARRVIVRPIRIYAMSADQSCSRFRPSTHTFRMTALVLHHDGDGLYIPPFLFAFLKYIFDFLKQLFLSNPTTIHFTNINITYPSNRQPHPKQCHQQPPLKHHQPAAAAQTVKDVPAETRQSARVASRVLVLVIVGSRPKERIRSRARLVLVVCYFLHVFAIAVLGAVYVTL